MTTKKNLVKQMFMSILTAAIFSFSFVFTACSDDEFVNNPEEGSNMIGNYANYEPYGLTYHNFDGAESWASPTSRTIPSASGTTPVIWLSVAKPWSRNS